MLFPNQNKFNSIIKKISRRHNIPIPVIKGLVGVESAFNPNAIREEPHLNDASRGLTQILLRTAQGIGFRGSPRTLFNPSTNLHYGILFFRNLLSKYQNLDDAIASYNMGFPRPAHQTTPLIIRLFGHPQPHWRYANQPYVDRVKDTIQYFTYLERGQILQAEKKATEIRRRRRRKPTPTISPFILVALIGILLFTKK